MSKGEPYGMDSPEASESTSEPLTTFISGNTFRARKVEYVVIDGLAIFEGDIILGTAEEMQKIHSPSDLVSRDEVGDVSTPDGVVISGTQYRWPKRNNAPTVPYVIASALPNQARVNDAIQHWEDKTCIRFVPRNAAQHPNYVSFVPASNTCSSPVGMRGGNQVIKLANGCNTGSTIHEIGHSLGAWHEQSRADRDTYVEIKWQNIKAGKEHNFYQHITDGDDIGNYDYCSIMHYGRKDFSKNGQDTIVPRRPTGGCVLGGRSTLSDGDISAMRSIYQCGGGGGGTRDW